MSGRNTQLAVGGPPCPRQLEVIVIEPWVSAEAVQQHLGISQDTLYRLIADRGLPATKIGGRWRFKLTLVDAWAVAGGASEPNEDETPGGKK
jgi:excisionase family DNA binding protein